MSKAKTAGDNHILAYYQAISDGSISVGKWIKLFYDRIIGGLEQGEYFFDQKKADRAIEWIEKYCHHTEGVLAPGKLKLELWQKAILSVMFGIVDEDGQRQFQEVVLIVARKNGKSLFASAIALYTFFVDGGYGTKIYNIAPKLDQAEIIYSNIWANITMEDDLLEDPAHKGAEVKARHRMTDLYIEKTNSTVKKIAFSAKKSDGFNPSLCVCDEIAAWAGDQGLKQYEVMRSGMGARPEGIMFSCSTSGYINDSIYDELLKRCTKFLQGDSKEKRLAPFLYMIDDITKWNDINELRKSNPNLGVSVSVKYLLEEIAVAEGSLSKKGEFITKYCNIKQNSSIAWLNTTDVDKTESAPLSLEDFKGHYCVGGIDLSRTTDLTSACVVIEKDEKLYIISKFWMPAERIEFATAKDGLPYRAYIQRGFLQPSGENFVDYHDVYKWFTDLIEKYKVYPLMVGYDKYSAQYLIHDLEQYGYKTDDVYQGFNMTPAIRELEGSIKDGKVCIGDNDLLKIHLLNTALKSEADTERVKIVKLSDYAHIDGTAAVLCALIVKQKYAQQYGKQIKNIKR